MGVIVPNDWIALKVVSTGRRLSNSAFHVLYGLQRFSNWYGNYNGDGKWEFLVSIEDLAYASYVSKDAAMKALKELIRLGVVERVYAERRQFACSYRWSDWFFKEYQKFLVRILKTGHETQE